MSDADKAKALQGTNAVRVDRLTKNGVQLGGINEHYLVSLLEAIAEKLEVKDSAHLSHEQWLSDTLDQNEEQILKQARMAQLANGVSGNGQLLRP